MTKLDADLLTRDVDGSALQVRGTPRVAGARLSKNFKKVAAGTLGLVTAGIFVGIFTAGNDRSGNSGGPRGGTGPTNPMVGQTQPDMDAMQRSALQKKTDPKQPGSRIDQENARTGISAVTVPTPDADRGAGGILTTQDAQTSSAPDKKYKQWLEEERYKVLEAEQVAAQSATSAKLSPQGSDRAMTNSPPAPSTTADPSVLSRLLETAQSSQGASAQAPAGPHGLESALASLGAGSASHSPGTNIASTADSQATNQSFLDRQANSMGPYLSATLEAPLARYELFAGSVIPAVLVTGIQSDLPGTIAGLVRQTVYDSRHPEIVLVPQGTRLLGLYTSQIAYGQRRVLIAWNRLIFPNGSTLELGGMQGTDSQGEAGFADETNNHTARIFGSAILTSLLGVGAQLSQPQNSSALTSPSASQQSAAAVANELNQVGATLLNRNLAIQPTLTIRPGYAFDVLVNRTMVLPPY
jgi:type IV secretion system protein VirB10